MGNEFKSPMMNPDPPPPPPAKKKRRTSNAATVTNHAPQPPPPSPQDLLPPPLTGKILINTISCTYSIYTMDCVKIFTLYNIRCLIMLA